MLGLDYFEGDSMQKHPDRDQFDFPGWVKAKQQRAAVLIPPWVEAIKKDYGECRYKRSSGTTPLTAELSGGEETQYFCVGKLYCGVSLTGGGPELTVQDTASELRTLWSTSTRSGYVQVCLLSSSCKRALLVLIVVDQVLSGTLHS